MCNVGSDPDVARFIILLDLKRFAGKFSVGVFCLVFLKSLYHMEVWDFKTPL